MANNEYFNLPELIELAQFEGNFNRYLDAVYELFKRDFIDHKPVFRGMRLGLKKYPLSQNKEATFWHMTSEGDNEDNRIPDLRRMERIQWPAPMINNSTHPYLKVWENTRGTKTNVLIFHDAENYLVVLRKANGYIIPWTAYLIEHQARRDKLMKEYEDYKKQEAV